MNRINSKLLLAVAITLALSNTVMAEDTKTKDPVAGPVTNARQEAQIWTTYALSPYLRANNIKVSVDAGKATLTGTVEEDVNKDLATAIAKGVTGIKDVDNKIEVLADYKPSIKKASNAEALVDARLPSMA